MPFVTKSEADPPPSSPPKRSLILMTQKSLIELADAMAHVWRERVAGHVDDDRMFDAVDAYLDARAKAEAKGEPKTTATEAA